MLFTNGECPLCCEPPLLLNEEGFVECPNCHLQLAVGDLTTATIIPQRGSGKFREDQSDLPEFSDMSVAEALGFGLLPNYSAILLTRSELEQYVKDFLREH